MVEYIKLRMKQTVKGAIDASGTVVQEHAAGCVYDLPDYLAKVYLAAKYAEPVQAVVEVKADVEPPKNSKPGRKRKA